MGRLRIAIIDPSQSEKTIVEAPDDVELHDFIPALVERMGLPVRAANGRPVRYRLAQLKEGNLGELSEDNTLNSAGVKENDTLQLIPEMTAGGGQAEEHYLARPSVKPDVAQMINLSAPIFIPNQESLAIGLVPTDVVDRLEEYRSDEMRWEAIMWAFIGAILGIIVNWVTQEPIVISRTSIILLVLFSIMAILVWSMARDFKRRANKMKEKILNFKRDSRGTTSAG